MKNEYGKPNERIISMASFARKNLIQSGFIAGLRFCGVDLDELYRNNPERYEDMRKALMDSFEEHGLTREIEF